MLPVLPRPVWRIGTLVGLFILVVGACKVAPKLASSSHVLGSIRLDAEDTLVVEFERDDAVSGLLLRIVNPLPKEAEGVRAWDAVDPDLALAVSVVRVRDAKVLLDLTSERVELTPTNWHLPNRSMLIAWGESSWESELVAGEAYRIRCTVVTPASSWIEAEVRLETYGPT